ncbi:unnamed protein product [Rotaria sp. Silwood1]|nr:unnamed protein product [Rotaria sp. Silwood1]
MTIKVVPVYQAAYRMLNDDIIQPILNFNETFGDTEDIKIMIVHHQHDEHNTAMYSTEEVAEENVRAKQNVYETRTIENINNDEKVETEQASEQTTQNALLHNDNLTVDADIHLITEIEVIETHTTPKNHFNDWTFSSKELSDNETHESLDTIEHLSENIIVNNIQVEDLNSTLILATVDRTTAEVGISELNQFTSEENRLKVLVDKIRIAVNGVYTNLKNASSECVQLRTKLNLGIASAVIVVSKQEELCREVSTTIDQLTSYIRNQDQQVAFAEQVVREREAAVQNAERAQRDAEHKVDRARVCQNRRRKKRFLGFISQAANWVAKPVAQATNWAVKPVVQATNWAVKPVAQAVTWAVIKPVCSVVNSGGIDIAKDARSSAQRMLGDAQQRLSNERQRVSQKRTELSVVQIKQTYLFNMNNAIQNVLIVAILLKTASADFAISHYRQRRGAPTVDLSLRKPVINPLTEKTSIDDPWERCMIIAPMTIQLLGQLLVVSSKIDVSFQKFSPNRTYKYIRNSQSLRATLVQISNDGYQAFLSAHSAMNSIQLNMLQIPKHIKTALKLLAGNFPTSVLKKLLPQVLQNLEDTGNECVELSNNTRHEFLQVMLLLGEVIEVTTTTQSLHDEEIRNNEKKIAALRTIEDGIKKEEEFRMQHYKEASDSVKRAEDSYYAALRAIPTGFKAILQDFSRAILNMVPTLAGVITGGPVGALAVTALKLNVGPSGPGDSSNPSSKSVLKQVLSVGHSQTLVMANQFSNSLQTFIEAVSSTGQNSTVLEGYVTTFKTFRGFITSLSDNPAKQTAIDLIKRTENLVLQELAKVNQKKKKTAINNVLIEQLQDIAEQLKPIQTAAQFTDQKTTGQTLTNIGNHPAYGARDSSKNELFKAQLAQANLVDMKRFQDEQAASYLALLGEMRQLSSQMVAIEFTTLQSEEIVRMLEKALDLLGRLRFQWNNFVLFFTDMSIKIKNMIRGPLRRFLQTSRAGNDATAAARMQLIGTLKDDTFGIHREAYVLFVMSRTYYDVSSQYLMGRLAGLSTMLTVKTDEDRSKMMKSIEKDTNSTLEQVEEMIRERKQAFDTEMEKKNAELVSLITQLGGNDEINKSAIKKGQKLASTDAEWGDD